jgi:hypothetical protein
METTKKWFPLGWICEYCCAESGTRANFEHEPDCIIPRIEAILKKAEDE